MRPIGAKGVAGMETRLKLPLEIRQACPVCGSYERATELTAGVGCGNCGEDLRGLFYDFVPAKTERATDVIYLLPFGIVLVRRGWHIWKR